MYEIDQFGYVVWDYPLPLYAWDDPIAHDRDDEPRPVFGVGHDYEDDIPF